MTQNSLNSTLGSFTNISDSLVSLLEDRAETPSISLLTNQDFIAIIKRIDELDFELKQIKEGKRVSFLYVENKWKFVETRFPCCEKQCINTYNPDLFCTNGNGFIQIKSGTNVIYINCRKERGTDKLARIIAKNRFNRPKENSTLFQCCLNCTTFTFFYYEVKITIKKGVVIGIGLRSQDILVALWAPTNLIFYYFQSKGNKINLPSFSIKDGDVLGCGLVYPPSKNDKKLPYAFFTQNGKQIGKTLLLKENYEYQPYLDLKCCSVETNFGDDLTSKPFLYNISKHYVAEEFYKDEEFHKDEEVYKGGW